MKTLNSGYVYFAMYGEFDPQQLSHLLKIQPTSTRLRGSVRPDQTIPKQSQWRYSTDDKSAVAIDIYEMSDWVVAELEPHRKDIINAIHELNLDAVLQVVIRFSTDDDIPTPAIGFSRHVLSFVDAVGATIDIDTYIEPDS